MDHKSQVLKRLEELSEKRELLLSVMAELPQSKLLMIPGPGKWSPLQILFHTQKSEEGTLRYIRKKLSFSPNGLPPASYLAGVRLFLLELILASPLKFKAPKGLDVMPDHPDFEELRKSWAQTHTGFRALIEGLDQPQLRWQLFRHPMIGRIDMSQTLRFMSSHFEHHRRQIEKLVG